MGLFEDARFNSKMGYNQDGKEMAKRLQAIVMGLHHFK